MTGRKYWLTTYQIEKWHPKSIKNSHKKTNSSVSKLDQRFEETLGQRRDKNKQISAYKMLVILVMVNRGGADVLGRKAEDADVSPVRW